MDPKVNVNCERNWRACYRASITATSISIPGLPTIMRFLDRRIRQKTEKTDRYGVYQVLDTVIAPARLPGEPVIANEGGHSHCLPSDTSARPRLTMGYDNRGFRPGSLELGLTPSMRLTLLCSIAQASRLRVSEGVPRGRDYHSGGGTPPEPAGETPAPLCRWAVGSRHSDGLFPVTAPYPHRYPTVAPLIPG
jgi:hypothetical protein